MFTDHLTYSFLIVSFFETPHIHRSIPISCTSSLLSRLFVLDHVSAPYGNAGLTTVLYTLPIALGLEVAESLPAGSEEDWLCWRALNRLRTGVGRAKTVMRKWGYLDDAQSVDCNCGEPQTMAHLLSCRLLDEACTADDLATVTERAKACARKWEKIV